jgi:type VI secretion system protein ImpC
MPRADTYASVAIETAEKTKLIPVEAPPPPFRILVLGDLTGGSGRNRRVIEIDRDNFDEVLGRLAPDVQVEVSNTPLAVHFRELDDFHPDRLFAGLAPFAALRRLRSRLADPATFAAAAAELAPPASRPDPEIARLSGADLLRQLTGEAVAPARAPARSDWEQMLHEMVAPYAAARPDPRQPELIAQTDAAIAGQMRAIMHHPAFRGVEAAWRALYFLTRRLETGEDLKIFVLDVPKEELMSDAGLAALRYELSAEDWSVVAGLYEFGPADEQALIRIAGMARDASAPFVSGLAPDVVGLSSAFPDLRHSAAAGWMGLALPRFLLRLPYGSETDETETFAFEEMPSPPEHERYLWGHPAIACAYLLGDAFSRQGWDFRPGASHTLEGLPVHVYKSDGESQLKPCAEVLMTEEAAITLLDHGFIPLASIKGTDRVRVVSFRSVAEPAAPLSGRWS